MKCESPRDPEKQRRAWDNGESVASAVPLPFDEVVSGEFSPVREEDLSAAPSAQRCKTSAGQFSMRWRLPLILWEEASEKADCLE